MEQKRYSPLNTLTWMFIGLVIVAVVRASVVISSSSNPGEREWSRTKQPTDRMGRPIRIGSGESCRSTW